MTEKHQDKNIVWHHATVNRLRREAQNNHRSVAVWFTGFSGSGKSTIAHAVEESLFQKNCRTFVLDGDNVRHGLCDDLGFTVSDRSENIRRISQIVRLFVDAGLITLAAFISPMRKDRERARQLIGEKDFIEIYVRCPIEICESRDDKGLYRRARVGEIPEFTGISAPYEEPEAPALILDTGVNSIEQCADRVIQLLKERGVFQ